MEIFIFQKFLTSENFWKVMLTELLDLGSEFLTHWNWASGSESPLGNCIDWAIGSGPLLENLNFN